MGIVTNMADGHSTDGTFLISDLRGTASALQSGDWVAAGLMGVADTLDFAATVSDPIGSLFAAGAGWVLDHIEPLKGWLDDLTGDAGAVEALAARWEAVARSLDGVSGDLRSRVSTDLAHMQGLSITQYRAFVEHLAQTADGLKEGAEAVAGAIKVASTLVDVVHGIVRDSIAQLVGSALSWIAEETLSFGLASGWVAEQIDTRVSAITARIGGTVKALITSCHQLEGLVRKLDEAVGKLREFLDKLHPDAARGAHRAGWLDHPRATGTNHVPRHEGTIKSIPDRWKDVAKTEVLYNGATEGTVGDAGLAADQKGEGGGSDTGAESPQEAGAR